MKLARVLIEFTNQTLGRLKAKRRIDLGAQDDLRLNLGCGLAVTKGWLNIDGSPSALIAGMPTFVHRLMYRMTGANRYYSEETYCALLRDHRFLHHDLAYGLPLKEGVADHIYSSHFFEHLYRPDAIHLFKECLRVLKPGGLMRVSIPDLEFAVSLYAKGEKDRMLKSYFFVEDHAAHYSRHKYMYDFPMLEALLSEIGFRDIVRRSFQAGEMPDVNLLDNRPEDSLFVEARK